MFAGWNRHVQPRRETGRDTQEPLPGFHAAKLAAMKRYLELIDTNTLGQRYDVTPIFSDPLAYSSMIDDLSELIIDLDFDVIAGIDALGFILASAWHFFDLFLFSPGMCIIGFWRWNPDAQDIQWFPHICEWIPELL